MPEPMSDAARAAITAQIEADPQMAQALHVIQDTLLRAFDLSSETVGVLIIVEKNHMQVQPLGLDPLATLEALQAALSIVRDSVTPPPAGTLPN